MFRRPIVKLETGQINVSFRHSDAESSIQQKASAFQNLTKDLIGIAYTVATSAYHKYIWFLIRFCGISIINAKVNLQSPNKLSYYLRRSPRISRKNETQRLIFF